MTTRYRLDVVAPDIGDAVRFAGGWMFDLALAGWEVRILVAQRADDRPCRILGARAVDIEAHLTPASGFPEIVAVAAELLISNSHVRDHVAAALGLRDTAVTVWGQTSPDQRGSTDIVKHQLSTAAMAFKSAALAAAGLLRTRCEETESFSNQPGQLPKSLTLLTASDRGPLRLTTSRVRKSQ